MGYQHGKRFLIIASYPGSIVTFRGEFIRELLASGFMVDVCAPFGSSDEYVMESLEGWGVNLHSLRMERTGLNPYADISYLFRLIRLIRKVRPDVSLAYTIKPVIYGSLAAWICGVNDRYVLITGLGYAFQNGGQHQIVKKLVNMLYKIALKTTHKCFFQNIDDQKLFRDRRLLSVAVPSVVLNGSGVDTEYYGQSLPPERGMKFLMIARLLRGKGVREYSKAARIIRREYPDVSFQLAGWLDENPDAISQEELDKWVLEGDIDYLGHLEDVRPAIRNSHVYVLPSYREGTPRTVLEAMSMGRPIITTDAPGCRETVLPGVNGYLVPIMSVDELALAMRKFIESPVLCLNMGGVSRQIAEDKYDVHKVNRKFLSEMGVE